MPTTVRDILNTKGNKVDHIGPDATVRDALQRMAELNIGALVVMEGDRLAGIISERDYARKIVLKGRTSLDTSVRDIMSSRVICARPSWMDFTSCALMMPCAPSMPAWASEPSMSACHMRWSKDTLEV